MTNHLPINCEQVARAAEEMIAQRGDSALVEAGKKIRPYGGRLKIGVPKKHSVPTSRIVPDLTSRIVPDLTQADRAYAIAMGSRRYEDKTRKEGVRVAKPGWDVKRVCQSCATKYYGLGRSSIACPQCGTRFDPEAPLKSCCSRPVFVG